MGGFKFQMQRQKSSTLVKSCLGIGPTSFARKFSLWLSRSRGSLQLGTVLLACEGRFRRVKGYAEIAPVMARLEAEQTEPQPASTKKVA